MKKIWKFPLKPTGTQKIEMPYGAEILCVQTQYDTANIWAIVDPEAKK